MFLTRLRESGGTFVLWVDTWFPTGHWWDAIAYETRGRTRTNDEWVETDFHHRRAQHMSKELKRIEEASRLFTAGIAVLMGVDAESVTEAVKQQTSNTKNREKVADDDDEKPSRSLKAPAKKDDDDEDEKPAKKVKGIPDDDDLQELDRAELKSLAEKNDLDPAGKARGDLIKMLQEARDGKKAGGKKKTDDDDDDDEKPAKGKKKDEEEEEEVEYPGKKEMKADLEVFFKLNRDLLKSNGFYGGKPQKGVEKAPITYEALMADLDEIKEAWKDNVHPEIESGNWTKMKKEAAKIEDDDDE
jgi:hypothetical protein